MFAAVAVTVAVAVAVAVSGQSNDDILYSIRYVWFKYFYVQVFKI
jgi:hypothetical protein